jgi:hypothetical protein
MRFIKYNEKLSMVLYFDIKNRLRKGKPIVLKININYVYK